MSALPARPFPAPADRPHACPESLAKGSIRMSAEDFCVTETLGFDPDGEGEHVLLEIEKRGANTRWVAGQLASFSGQPRRAVSYSGLKDRHALVRQWFSVHVPPHAEPDWSTFEPEGVRVLRAARHRRKLRRGSHRANHFRLVVRELTGPVGALDERLCAVARAGVPNYFGPQRYGRDAGNLPRALAVVEADALPRVSRAERSMLLSAMRSFVFDEVLAKRVSDGSWNRLMVGDLANLDGCGSVFPVAEVDAVLRARAERLDVHPTGPLWGRGAPATMDGVQALEECVAEGHGWLTDALGRAGLSHARRSLRLRVDSLHWTCHDGALELAFTLPPGAYATVVLREVLETREPERGRARA